jgi:hypothetical protein
VKIRVQFSNFIDSGEMAIKSLEEFMITNVQSENMEETLLTKEKV